MPKLCVRNFSISLDGYAAGPDQSLEHPLGVDGPLLHEWVFATRVGQRMLGSDSGAEGLDNDFLARGDAGVGATIMGRNMFGPIRGAWENEQWTGWWGDDPPYHHPVFVRRDASGDRAGLARPWRAAVRSLRRETGRLQVR